MHGRYLRLGLGVLALGLAALALAACSDAGPQPSMTADETATPAVTATPAPTASATPIPAAPPATPTPTASPAPAASGTPATPTPTPTPTASPVATASGTPATPTPSPTATATSTTLSYSSYDTTGAVATAGSYAFLTEGNDGAMTAVTTYEGLRDGTATSLLIHKSDAAGTSRADVFDTVEAGDLFEWKEADDCFVRYTVTEVKPDPAGTVPRKALDVEWMTYAFTGCSGAVSTDADASVTWGTLPDLGGASLSAPVVHGTAQLTPAGWTGAVKAQETHAPPAFSDANPISTADPAVARGLPYWRDPVLPEGWMLGRANSGGVDYPPYGYCADYLTASGRLGVEICGYHDGLRFRARAAHSVGSGVIVETLMLVGRPARVLYTPAESPHLSPVDPITVWVYDAATEAVYRVHGNALSLRGSNLDAVISIARSLFPE